MPSRLQKSKSLSNIHWVEDSLACTTGLNPLSLWKINFSSASITDTRDYLRLLFQCHLECWASVLMLTKLEKWVLARNHNVRLISHFLTSGGHKNIDMCEFWGVRLWSFFFKKLQIQSDNCPCYGSRIIIIGVFTRGPVSK